MQLSFHTHYKHPISLHKQDVTQGQILNSTIDSNSVCLLLESYMYVKEPSLLYYLPKAGGKIFGFITFPKSINTVKYKQL